MCGIRHQNLSAKDRERLQAIDLIANLKGRLGRSEFERLVRDLNTGAVACDEHGRFCIGPNFSKQYPGGDDGTQHQA